MQNISVLQAQVDSLKEIIDMMERNNSDTLAKKWRVKVYEELVRNKQQQILHSNEIKKLRAKESQTKAALESAHLQASSLNLERTKLQKEVQILQTRLRNSNINSNYLLNLQSVLSNNLELSAKTLAMLDAFNHRITFSMSKIKTAKILHTREIFSLRNKLAEENNGQRQLSEEISRLNEVEHSNIELRIQNEQLFKELSLVNDHFRKAEETAKNVIDQSNSKFSLIVTELETQLDEKVSEINSLFSQLALSENAKEKLTCEIQQSLDSLKALQQENEILALSKKVLQNSVKELSIQNESLKQELSVSDALMKDQKMTVQNIEELQSQIDFLTEQIKEKDEFIEGLKQDVQSLTNEVLDSKAVQESLRQKMLKCEQGNKELRRERDILFEAVKKNPAVRGKDEEVQTETLIKSAQLIKTKAIRSEEEVI